MEEILNMFSMKNIFKIDDVILVLLQVMIIDNINGVTVQSNRCSFSNTARITGLNFGTTTYVCLDQNCVPAA
jgi:ABC-type iron transport system FetAB permease component